MTDATGIRILVNLHPVVFRTISRSTAARMLMTGMIEFGGVGEMMPDGYYWTYKIVGVVLLPERGALIDKLEAEEKEALDG